MMHSHSRTSKIGFLYSSLRVGKNRDWGLFSVFLFSLGACFLAYISRLQSITHDAFHEMALFREWLTTGHFPLNDVFAYTPTVAPAVHHEWATGVLLYFVSAASPLGIGGLIALKLILVAGLWLLLYRVARGNGAHPLVFAVLSVIVFPLMWVGFATVRAQLFTLVAIVLQMLLLQSDWHGRKRWIWIWIPMYLVWLNVHAGFVVGIAMLAIHGIERCICSIHESARLMQVNRLPSKVRSTKDWLVAILEVKTWNTMLHQTWHLWLLAPIIAIGLLCNPWGADYFPYLVRAITMPRPSIAEWQPLWMTYDPWTTLFAFFVAVTALGYAAWHRRWDRLRGWMLCFLAAYMTLKHIRHGSLFGVLWIATVPAWLTPTPIGKRILEIFARHRSSGLGAALGIGALSLGFAIWQPFWKPTLTNDGESSLMTYPIGAADYLAKHHFVGNVMTPFQHGAYISWRLHPNVLVSLDGRYEVAFQKEVLPAHDRFYQAETDWRAQLDRYDTDLVIVPQDTPIRARLPDLIEVDEPSWKIVYEDDSFTLLGRSDSALPFEDHRKEKLEDRRKENIRETNYLILSSRD